MKLKAVVPSCMPQELIDELNNLRDIVMERVLKTWLHAEGFGPAEFYVQECDIARNQEPFCEVRLSGVSVTDSRSVNDFTRAAEELDRIYQAVILKHMLPGVRVQLMVAIMLDQPLPRRTSSLVEVEAHYVSGDGN